MMKSEEIFRAELGTDLTLVVKRTGVEGSSIIKSMIPEGLASRAASAYSVSVEIVAPRQPGVVIAALIEVEQGPPDVGFHVLQVARGTDGVVLVVAKGTNLGLWRIGITQMDKTALTWLRGWVANALIMPRDAQNVGTDLQALPGGRWRVDVTDKSIANGAATTSFNEEGADWHFVITYSFADRIAAAEPHYPFMSKPDNSARPKSPPKDVKEICVFCADDWWLRIYQDGSGAIGYGDMQPDGLAFPVGTFQYAELLPELFHFSPEDIGYKAPSSSVAFRLSSGVFEFGHPVGNSAVAWQLFATAHMAIQGYSQRSAEFEEAWSKSPPRNR
jgi:hypothetical protein